MNGTVESKVPTERLTSNQRPMQPSGGYVACILDRARRTYWNYAVQRAGDWSRELRLPLLVVEILRIEDRSTARSHRFLLDGMASTAHRLMLAGVAYHPYVELEPGSAEGLVEEVSTRATLLVRDGEPTSVNGPLMETVDACFLLPRSLVDGSAARPIEERLRGARGEFRKRLLEFPERNPLTRIGVDRLPGVPPRITTRWPAVSGTLLAGDPSELASLPIEAGVAGDFYPGGADRARENWRELLLDLAPKPAEDSAVPRSDQRAIRERRLRRHLRAGHISPHQVVAETMRHLEWTPAQLAATDDVPAQSWWGMPARLERLLDELLLGETGEGAEDGR